jgi:hypothetical protein
MTTMQPDNPNPQTFQFGPVPNDRFEHPSLPYTAFSMVATGFGDSTLVVGLPMGGSVQFDLRRFPMRTWVTLQDNSGEPIPLAIYIDGGVVAGKWLEPQPVPTPMPQVMT